MIKFIAKTAVTIVKVYAVYALVGRVYYLDYKVSELEKEIGKLKADAKG